MTHKRVDLLSGLHNNSFPLTLSPAFRMVLLSFVTPFVNSAGGVSHIPRGNRRVAGRMHAGRSARWKAKAQTIWLRDAQAEKRPAISGSCRIFMSRGAAKPKWKSFEINGIQLRYGGFASPGPSGGRRHITQSQKPSASLPLMPPLNELGRDLAPKFYPSVSSLRTLAPAYLANSYGVIRRASLSTH